MVLWQHATVRELLRGTHDSQSLFGYLRAQHHILEGIVRRLPEVFLNALLDEMLKANPAAIRIPPSSNCGTG